MKNKNGFISMALVYSYLIIFLFLMLAILRSYSSKNRYLEAIDDNVNKDVGVTSSSRDSIFTKMIEDNSPLTLNNVGFTTIANNSVGNGNGLFYTDDVTHTDENNDGVGKRIYFYRGTINNNFVVFGKSFTRNAAGKIDDASLKSICWRIVRTNENSSVRIVFYGYLNSNGACVKANGIGASTFNNAINDNAYVGYTYGKAAGTSYNETHYSYTNAGEVITTDSNIKKFINNWYENNTNLYNSGALSYETQTSKIKYEPVNSLISDAIYCGDKKISNRDSMHNNANVVINNTKNGFSTNNTFYTIGRIFDTANTLEFKNTFVCSQLNDSYSLSSNMGGENINENALENPVGLLTVDDLIFAGGAYGKNNTGYYLNMGSNYWTMSPSIYYNSEAKNIYVDSNGRIFDANVNTSNYVLPVISINSLLTVETGSGLIDDPYVLN